jgi:predicted metal-dependent hydrolase
MKKSIELLSRTLEYTLTVSPRAKHMRVSIRNGGDMRVTVPRFVPHFLVENFMKKKASWIVETFDIARTKPVHQHKDTHAEYQAYKEQARTLAHERVVYYAKHYQFTWGAISIRNQKTRWGSCSSKGNLAFSYKLALLPPHLADYIVVHELCHLKELNHSDRFWNLVEQMIPNHKALRKELNEQRVDSSV